MNKETVFDGNNAWKLFSEPNSIIRVNITWSDKRWFRGSYKNGLKGILIIRKLGRRKHRCCRSRVVGWRSDHGRKMRGRKETWGNWKVFLGRTWQWLGRMTWLVNRTHGKAWELSNPSIPCLWSPKFDLPLLDCWVCWYVGNSAEVLDLTLKELPGLGSWPDSY